MKLMPGVLAVAAVLLMACGTPPPEDTAPVDPAELRTSESALRGDCTVSVRCADGTTRSCSGTSTGCSASTWNGLERVTCNGASYSCPAPAPLCSTEGQPCSTNANCGAEAYCHPTTRRCLCLA